MSNTNGDLILSALQALGVATENQRAPSASQGEHGLTVLNDMLFEWRGLGVDLEWSLQDSTTDDCPLDETQRQTVKANLTVRLAPTYGKPIDPVTAGIASSGFDRLARDAVLAAQQTQNMSNLPISTGNYWQASRILTG